MKSLEGMRAARVRRLAALTFFALSVFTSCAARHAQTAADNGAQPVAPAQRAPGQRPKILAVAHMALYVSDMAKAREFYKDFLGFDEPYNLKKKDGTDRIAFIKINEDQYLELFAEEPKNDGRLNHISFLTDDAEGLRQYLAAHGVKVPDQVGKGKVGNSNYNIVDPDNHTVEIVQYEPDGWTRRERGKFLPDTRISTRMAHVGVLVSSLDESMKFYRDVLGFKEFWRGSSSGKKLTWVNMRVPDGDDYLEMMLYDKFPDEAHRGVKNHICLVTPDVKKAAALLETRPARKSYTRPIELAVGTNRKRQFNLFDPDGTRVELMEPATVDGTPTPSSNAPVPHGEPPPVAVAPSAAQPLVYVGGFDGPVAHYRLDLARGTLTEAGMTTGTTKPGFLAFSPNGRNLYSIDEVEEGRVVAFSIAPDGALTRLNDVSSMGIGPAHLSVDPLGKFVMVANYARGTNGTIAVLPIAQDGRLVPAVDTKSFGQDSNPHWIMTDPSGRFVLVVCKGAAFVAQYVFDAATGKLKPNAPEHVAAKPGVGPRHLAFHPGGHFAYVVNEQGSSMTSYRWDSAHGTLEELQTLSMLPPGFSGTSTGGEVQVHPSGRFVYGSNRGHDSIAVFAVDAASGRLTFVAHETRGIKIPRHFSIDPSGRFLLVANQGSDSVSVFRIDAATGSLSPTGAPKKVTRKPSFVGFLGATH